MKIVGVTGLKDSGKTTLVTKIVERLSEKGHLVGTIKKTHSEFDLKGRDTYKHSEAGAKIVAGDGTELFIKLSISSELNEIIKMIEKLYPVEYVIVEGYKDSEYMKIATSDYDPEDTSILKVINVMEMTDSDLDEAIDIIEKHSFSQTFNLDCGKCGFDTCNEFMQAKLEGNHDYEDCKSNSDHIVLEVDGKNIPMNPFVQKLVKNVVVSLAETLRTSEFGSEDFKDIKIDIKSE